VRVEVQDVRRNPGRAVAPHDVEGLVGGLVGDLALPESEAPARGHPALAREIRVAGEDPLRRVDEEVVVEEIVLDGNLDVGGAAAPYPAGHPGRVVEEDAPAARAPEEGDVLVAARCGGAEGLDHVEVDCLPHLVEGQEFLSEAEDGFLRAQCKAFDRQGPAFACSADPRVVDVPILEEVLLGSADLGRHTPRTVTRAQREGSESDLESGSGCREDHIVLAALDFDAGRRRRRSDDHGRIALGHFAALGVSHPQDAVGDDVDAERAVWTLARQECHPIIELGPPGSILIAIRSRAKHQHAAFLLLHRTRLHGGSLEVARLQATRVEIVHVGRAGHH
jgi:hypothetical protein